MQSGSRLEFQSLCNTITSKSPFNFLNSSQKIQDGGEIKANTFKFSAYSHCLPPCQPLAPQPGSFNLTEGQRLASSSPQPHQESTFYIFKHWRAGWENYKRQRKAIRSQRTILLLSRMEKLSRKIADELCEAGQASFPSCYIEGDSEGDAANILDKQGNGTWVGVIGAKLNPHPRYGFLTHPNLPALQSSLQVCNNHDHCPDP